MTASTQIDGRTDSTFPTSGVTGGPVLGQSSTFPNLQVPAGCIQESASDGLTAHAGGGQASALQLTSEINRITTVGTAGDSVRLPASFVGADVMIINHGTLPIQVYGAGTDTIDDVATATGVSQMANSTVLYFCTTAGAWYTEGLAGGFVRGYSLQTFSSAVVAANATGTQASGTPITAMQNQVSAGGANYSVTLPPSAVGMEITVHNVSGVALAVFPAVGETINGLSANAALSFPANTSTSFYCNVAGQWYTAPRVPS